MSNSPRVNYAVEVLSKHASQRNRLQNGIDHRKKIRDQIVSGIDVSKDPRYTYIMESAGLVIDFLRDIAKQFDVRNPEDQFSMLDISDILKIVELKLGLVEKKKNAGSGTSTPSP